MAIPWNLVIQFIIWLMAEGVSKESAVNTVAGRFGVSAKDIYSRGGFNR